MKKRPFACAVMVILLLLQGIIMSAQNITIGVMLPLHDINGDGRRMTEYYRGMLLAVGELKREGYDITVNAWNLSEDADVYSVMGPKANKCDLIFGPLYSKQVHPLAEFCKMHNIRMVIPFSIEGNEVETNDHIYQVYQSNEDITEHSISQFLGQFADSHPLFIDCNDKTSKKGIFTFGLRKELENRGVSYSITNVTNSPEVFAKAFSPSQRNVVVLNTGRSPELGQVFAKLDELRQTNPSCRISMFGYNEWFLYTKIYNDKLRLYDTYIPSTYDYNPASQSIQRIESLYKSYYMTNVQYALPRFALTGYDHTMFFVRGVSQYGKDFHGFSTQKCYTPVQTPLSFERVKDGGYQNHSFMLVHFK